MMKTILKRASFIGFILAIVPMVSQALSFKVGYNSECYVKDDGANDEHWFCGSQAPSCHGNRVRSKNMPHWQYHGDHFSYGGKTYWCCHGTTSQQGKYVEAPKWILDDKTVTHEENVAGGRCTWKEKWNVCGDKDEGQTEKVCTEPQTVLGCAAGYTEHNGKCVAPCKDDYVFESATSNNCIKCETTERQAIVQGKCKKCELNQILDKKTLQCVDILVIEKTKIQISAVAHEACWLCVSPSAMEKCLKYVTNGGKIKDDAELVDKCSLDSDIENK